MKNNLEMFEMQRNRNVEVHCNSRGVQQQQLLHTVQLTLKQTLTVAALRHTPLVSLSHIFFSLFPLRWESLSSSPAWNSIVKCVWLLRVFPFRIQRTTDARKGLDKTRWDTCVFDTHRACFPRPCALEHSGRIGFNLSLDEGRRRENLLGIGRGE